MNTCQFVIITASYSGTYLHILKSCAGLKLKKKVATIASSLKVRAYFKENSFEIRLHSTHIKLKHCTQ